MQTHTIDILNLKMYADESLKLILFLLHFVEPLLMESKKLNKTYKNGL